MGKLLTIAIPTYNRAADLEKNLSRLLPQVREFYDRVDLIVSDNCSPDCTQDVVSKWDKQYPRMIRYYRNNENKGYLYNFTQCIEKCETEYICLMGDDDIVAYGYISAVVEILYTYKVDILHYNSLSYRPYRNAIDAFYKKWDTEDIIQIFDTPYNFIVKTLDGPSFMSSLVFKKEIWIKGQDRYPEDCYGFDWFMKIYAGISESTCAFYSIPLVTRYVSQNEGYNHLVAKYFVVGMSRVFQNLDKDINGVYAAWIRQRNSNFRIYSDLMSIYSNRETYKSLMPELKQYVHAPLQKFVLYSSMYAPSLLFKLFIKPSLRILNFYYILKAKFNRK